MTGYACPLCGACAAEVVFEQRGVPVHQNVVCDTFDEARSFARADVVLAFCEDCGFVFNRAFDPRKLRYSAIYDNTQTHSPAFQQYLCKLRDYLQLKYGLHGKQVVEVGCGKGDFLRLMCAGGMNRGLGFDPSYTGPETAEQGAVRFVKAFYGDSQCDSSADFLCLRHVLEHIQYPMKMLKAIRNALGNHSDSVIYVEVPDLTWMLDHGAFWDFFYEHCSYFTAGTLAQGCEMAGFKVEKISSVFGGQYLCLEAKPASDCAVKIEADAGELSDVRMKIRAFHKLSEQQIQSSTDRVVGFHGNGGCAVWGAAAKGVTFANKVDPDCHCVRCLIDVNPSKRGKFIAGSGHPIIAPEDIVSKAREIGAILSMNPNYFEEQRTKLAQLCLDIPLIPV